MKFLLVNWFCDWRRMFRMSNSGVLSITILLALGMGGLTATFQPIYSLVYAPLPFPQPDRLVRIGGNIPLFNYLESNFEQRELLDRIFSNLTAYGVPSDSRMRIRVPDTGKNLQTNLLTVTEEFFETLGVQPVRGSSSGRREDGTRIVISHRFWQNELMGAEDVIGKPIFVFNQPALIVGVMSETFGFPIGVDIWVYESGQPWSVDSSATQFVGRLRPGISLEQAVRDLRAMKFIPNVYMLFGNDGPVLQSLQTIFYGDRLPMLRMVVAAAVLFLLLVCANVANLLIACGIRRKSEMTLRLAFGATRWKLVGQLLRETLPLVLIGGLAGFVIAELVSTWLQTQFPTLEGGEVAVPVKVAFFTVIVLAVTIISGLIPALQTTRVDLNAQLKSAVGSKRRFFSSQEILVGIQLCLTLALLIGSGVLLRSLMARVDFPIGWSPQQIVVVSAEFPSDQTSVPVTRRARFYQEALRQLETISEVVSVGSLNPIPFSADAIQASQMPSMILDAYKDPPSSNPGELLNQQSVRYIQGNVSPNGFDVLGIPLIAGRYFTSTEIANQLEDVIERRPSAKLIGNAIIVNRAFAKYFWPEENAVGKIVYGHSANPMEIVGVVSDFHLSNSETVAPMLYRSMVGTGTRQNFLLRLRSNASLANFQQNARQRLSDLDGMAWVEVRTLQEMVSAQTADRRLALQLISCFAVLGIAVSGLGVYATSTLMVVSRTREIGIRMAMGAQPNDILRLIFLRSARVFLIGLPCGLFLGWILARGLSSALFQVRSDDPVVWIISCVGLFVITTVAVLVPALRAARLNPLDAMRE